MNNRYAQLDSLRGYAVILVFLSHISSVVALPFLSTVVSVYSPFVFLFQGDSAITFFFVLSGFVLFLPYKYGSGPTYVMYTIKRFFRVYVPYLAAILFSIVCYLIFSTGGIKGYSPWFNDAWTTPLTIVNLVQHIFLLGNFNTGAYNNVIWFVVQEMRVSLIFPFLALAIKKFDWKISLLVGLCISLIGGLNNLFYWQTDGGYHTSIFYTMQYISLFVIGGLIAKHLDRFKSLYMKLAMMNKLLLFLFAITLICYNHLAGFAANFLRVYYFEEVASNYSVGIGSGMLILFALFSEKVKRILMIKPTRLLGRISFSLYLYHLPILFSLIYLFNGVLPIWITFLISIPTVLIISGCAWYLIESFAVKYGKLLALKADAYQKKRTLLAVNDSRTKTG